MVRLQDLLNSPIDFRGQLKVLTLVSDIKSISTLKDFDDSKKMLSWMARKSTRPFRSKRSRHYDGPSTPLRSYSYHRGFPTQGSTLQGLLRGPSQAWPPRVPKEGQEPKTVKSSRRRKEKRGKNRIAYYN